MSNKEEIQHGLTPEQWEMFENLAEEELTPEYEGNCPCCGEDFRDQPAGFIRWVESHCYDRDWDSGEYKLIKLENWQKREIRKIYATDRKGVLKYKTVYLCWPKRHGKTQIAAYYDLYRSINFPHQRCSIASNSAAQTEGTAYEWLVTTIYNSPGIFSLFKQGWGKVTQKQIRFNISKSTITPLTSSSASSQGRRDDVAHVTEAHEAKDTALFDSVSGGTGDTKNGLTQVDSHVGEESNFVYQDLLRWQEKQLKGTYFSYISYDSIDHAVKNGPSWIDENYLRDRYVRLSEWQFKKFHLNVPVSTGERLFPEWADCAVEVADPPAGKELEDLFLSRMENGTAWFGTGLDRGGITEKANRTILTLVAKGFPKKDQRKKRRGRDTDPYRDGEIFVVECVEIPGSDDATIKDFLKRWRRKYRTVTNCLENKEVVDLANWCRKSGIPFELYLPTAARNDDSIARLARLARDGRLKFPRYSCNGLLYVEGLRYSLNPEARGNKRYGYSREFSEVFQGEKGQRKALIKDDTIDSLRAALWGLREFMSPPASDAQVKSLQGNQREHDKLMDAYMEVY